MSEHKYHFVVNEQDVDYIRILREAPRQTPFILVEEKTRTNQPKVSVLLVHKSVLNNPELQGLRLGTGEVSPTWGGDTELGEIEKLHSYRYVWYNKKLPGIIKQQIEAIRRTLNPKNTKVAVTYL